MGKYENMMKCAQVRSLANEKQYRNAYDVLQTLNIDQITAITDLNTIADVYIQLQKYEEAKDIYLSLYDRLHTRRVLYQLIYLCLKCGDIEEAEEYYKEYRELDKSVDRIILRYYIDKAKGADRQVLIGYLQELKQEDYMEEWAYELAKLYHKEGMREECIQECSDIILWFGEGLIVEKALLLKHHYMEGADISSEKAIMEETRNMAAELKIAAAIAERNEREKALREPKEAGMMPEENTWDIQPADNIQEEAEEEEPQRVPFVPQHTIELEALTELQQALKRLSETTRILEEQYPDESVETYAESHIPEPVSDYNEETYTESYQKELKENYEQNQNKNTTNEPEKSNSKIEKAIAKIVRDIRKEKEPAHISIMGNVLEKNIEIGKYLAKELCRQQVLPTSRIARIHAEKLSGDNLEENQQKLMGGCLFIEEAGTLSLDAIQNLYQFINKARGNVIVILSDTEEKMETLLKKNRKLRNIVKYDIQI